MLLCCAAVLGEAGILPFKTILDLVLEILFSLVLAAILSFFAKKYKFLSAVLFLVLLFGALYGVFRYSVFIKEKMLKDTNIAVIFAVILVLSVYAATKGERVVLKFSTVAFIIAAFCLLVIFAVGIIYCDFSSLKQNIMPLHQKSIVMGTASLLPVFSALLFNKESTKGTALGISGGISGIILISLLTFGILGKAAQKTKIPIAFAVGILNVGRVFTRIDGLLYLFSFVLIVSEISFVLISAKNVQNQISSC